MDPHEPSLARLTQRLLEVETENRRLKVAVGVILLVVVAVGITAAAPGDHTVTASKLVVVDEQGRQRVLIGSTEEGGTGILLMDHEGKGRSAFLLSADDEPGIVMNGTDGEPRVVMRVSEEDRSSLSLCGMNCKDGLSLSITERSVMLGITDTDGRVRFLTYLRKDGTPEIRINDADQRPLWKAP